MTLTDERVALCALNKIFGYHPRLALQLMEKAGSAAAVFSGPPPHLPEHPELSEQVTAESLSWARQELGRLEQSGDRFVGLPDEDYPELLRACADPPLGLYLRGCSSPAEIFGLRPLIGIVGTRDASPYGREWCRKLVMALADARTQPCIVSGLAYGIDGIAHQTALECGLPTVGVMATGIDQVYPWRHSALATSLAGTPGCALVTDYPLDTAPVALNFVRRNRIIAGLAHAVIVVESKSKGGSLMTAKYACDYDRQVYALPGRLDDIRSAGCNSLILNQMAEIITCPEELVARLGLGAPSHWRAPGGSWAAKGDSLAERLARKYGESSSLTRLALAVRKHSGTSAEELSRLLSMPFREVMESIILLEADGVLSTDLLRRCSLTPAWA